MSTSTDRDQATEPTDYTLDPLYGLVDYNTAVRAGFFNSGTNLENEYAVRTLYSIPTYKLAKPVDRPVILVTTGGFAPIHNGHLNMMEDTKSSFERGGGEVVGGYIVPGHDTYVNYKTRDKLMHAENRIHMIDLALKDNDWLMNCPAFARVCPQELNFTQALYIIAYKYSNVLLKAGTPMNFEVNYVIGQDNAGFAELFPQKIRFAGSECTFTVTIALREKGATSSTAIRRGQSTDLPAAVLQFLAQQSIEHDLYDEQYVVRLVPDKWEDSTACREFGDHFLTSIIDSFGQNCPKIVIRNVYEQLTALLEDRDFNESPYPSILMDSHIRNIDMFGNDAKLDISRLFDINSPQWNAKTFTNRPGSFSLPLQFLMIPPGDYNIVEDDIASGATLDFVYDNMPANVAVYSQFILANYDKRFNKDKPLYDVIDMHDFLIGSSEGGLVCTLQNGKIGRVPYVGPYVNLHTRAKIPLNTLQKFNRAIWEMNVDYYEKYDYNVYETDEAFQNFVESLGYRGDISLYDFCLDQLKVNFNA